MITFSQLGKFGRVGNQLFQISATIAMAHRYDDQYVFPTWELEPHFNLRGCFSKSIKPTNTYKEPFFHYQNIPYSLPSKDCVLDLQGYYQSALYFEDCSNVIVGLLTPKITYPIQYDVTGIHIRRGDYLKFSDCHPPCGMDYFNKAIEICQTERYLVFSDDLVWAKANFIGEQFSFAEGNSAVTDLALMISCQNMIISNSSMSWWGAYLNKNPNKIVVAPQQWFGPSLTHDTKDLYISDWIKI